jgi:hypothetical protein
MVTDQTPPLTLADVEHLTALREDCIEGPPERFHSNVEEILGMLPALLATAREHLEIVSAMAFIYEKEGRWPKDPDELLWLAKLIQWPGLTKGPDKP